MSQWLSDAATKNGFNTPYLLGDANLDGSVNAPDLDVLGQNWLGHPNTWQLGDFNADGTVDAGGINKLAQNWLASIPLAAPTQSAPEPPTAIFLLFAVASMVCKYRLQ